MARPVDDSSGLPVLRDLHKLDGWIGCSVLGPHKEQRQNIKLNT